MLNVSEIFPSIQGEGIYLGRPMFFVRLAGCNLRCSYCDTKYHSEGAFKINDGALETQIKTQNITDICFTGGEPLLQWKELSAVIDGLDMKYGIHLETNGTIPLELEDVQRFDSIAVSPKLPSAGGGEDPRGIVIRWMQAKKRICGDTEIFFKFVVSDREDRQALVHLLKAEYLPKRSLAEEIGRVMPIVIQPQTEQENWKPGFKETIEWARQSYPWELLDARFMPRWHTALWGKERKK